MDNMLQYSNIFHRLTECCDEQLELQIHIWSFFILAVDIYTDNSALTKSQLFCHSVTQQLDWSVAIFCI